MKVGDLVRCNCATNTWYKDVPGIVVEMKPCSTGVLISGRILRLSRSQLEVVDGRFETEKIV